MMRLLVCGGRDYCNKAAVFAALDRAHAKRPVSVLITMARGYVDSLADEWAFCNGVSAAVYPAHPEVYGVFAEAVRDANVLADAQPDAVVAFPGEERVVDFARQFGLPVWQPEGV